MSTVRILFLICSVLIGIVSPIYGQTPAYPPSTSGALLREIYSGVAGDRVVDLVDSPLFRSGKASKRELLYGADGPTSGEYRYGERLRGWITVPVSGQYKFYIASDKSSELWLGSNDSKFSKSLIAQLSGKVKRYAWNDFDGSMQMSDPIALEAGQYYYIEALHKQDLGSGSSNNLSIGWKRPGATAIEVIPPQYLKSFIPTAEDMDDNGLPDAWEAQYGLSPSTNPVGSPDVGPWGDPDHDGIPNWMEYIGGTSPINPRTDGIHPDADGLRGFLSQQIWMGVYGPSISDFVVSRYYKAAPNVTGYVLRAGSQINYSDFYAQRIRGTIIAPVSGVYNFWIAGDDSCELWLSSNERKFQRSKIAFANSVTGVKKWTAYASQKSAPITLEAGKEYYIEILHKEHGGSDYVNVAWSYPGQTTQIIPSAYLRSYMPDPDDQDDDGLPDSWERQYGLDPQDNGSINPKDGSYGDADGDLLNNFTEYATGGNPLGKGGNKGYMEFNFWRIPMASGVYLSNLEDFTKSGIIGKTPEVFGYLTKTDTTLGFSIPNVEEYGVRVRATVTPKFSGNYQFAVAAGGPAELWLGKTQSRFSKRKIATVPAATGVRQFTKYTKQKSDWIYLEAGKSYHLEAVKISLANGLDGVKSNDNFSIAWQLQGQLPGTELNQLTVIDSKYLALVLPDPDDLDDDNLPDSWEIAHGLDPNDAGGIDPRNGEYGDPDGDLLSNFVEYATQGDPLARGGNQGLIRYDYWWLFPTTPRDNTVTLQSFTRAGVLPGPIGYDPAFSGYVNLSEIQAKTLNPVSNAYWFGARIRGVLTPAITGDYQFAIAADDFGELWISDDEKQFTKHKIAWVTAATNYRQFDKTSSQVSGQIHMEAGKHYYFEALQVQKTGADHLSVAWKLLGQPFGAELNQFKVIESKYLSVWTPAPNDRDDDGMPLEWEQTHQMADYDTAYGGGYGDRNGDGIINFHEFQLDTYGTVKGAFQRQIWKNVPGSTVSEFVHSARFSEPPDVQDLIFGSDAPRNVGDNYAQRLRTLVTPAVTGDYVFSIAGDDSVELWLSTNERKFNKHKVAWLGTNVTSNAGATGYLEWNKFFSQRTDIIHLEAGKTYFMEVLHKETTGSDHVSVAWEYTETASGAFTPLHFIPATSLSSFLVDPDDLDDDYLPDWWERQYGLDPTTKVGSNGEYGDPDGDKLTNFQEYQLGTNPKSADTDGDGISDYDEVVVFGSNPLVKDIQKGAAIASLSGVDTTQTSANWYAINDVSLVSTARRGWVEYQFTVSKAARHVFRVKGVARGEVTDAVDMPLIVDLDGLEIGSYALTCSLTSEGVASGFTPWLKPGQHVLRVRSQNLVGTRSLQVNGIAVEAIGGIDANGNGLPDWMENKLAQENEITFGGESLVSPFCLEGHATFPALVELQKDGGTAFSPFIGVKNHWYKDIELDPNRAISINALFENGAVQAGTELRWIPTNALKFTDPLIIRKGDSLRLTGYPGNVPNPSATVEISIGSTVLTTTADQALVYKFEQDGNFTVLVKHLLNGVVTEGTLSVSVLAADFGADFPIYVGRPRIWNLTGVSSIASIEKDPRVYLSTVQATQGQAFRSDVIETGELHVLARAGNQGPIVGRGTLLGLHVASTSWTADTSVVYTFDNGDRLVRMGIVADDLPPGGYIKIEIFAAGVTFQDGTRSKILRAEDFDKNGVTYVVFNYPAKTTTSVCHRLYLYDANDVLIGTR